MFDKLRAYLERTYKLTDDQFELIKSLYIPRRIKKKEFLQREGEIVKYGAFVTLGCLRKYTIDEDGKEHILQFAPEEWWIGDFVSSNKIPTRYFIDAIENSEVLLIDMPSQEQAFNAIPEMRAQYLAAIQRHAAAKDKRITAYLSASAEERYAEFLHSYPSIAHRVPQHMLASYLGISPETLSRIRKEMASGN